MSRPRVFVAAVCAWVCVAAVPAHTQPGVVNVEDVSYADKRVRNLLRIARCETGYLHGRPNWRHHNSVYTGGLGFAHSTWTAYKRLVRPAPKARYAAQASVREQLAVGLVLVEAFHGYSSWPACSRRLGLR